MGDVELQGIYSNTCCQFIAINLLTVIFLIAFKRMIIITHLIDTV